MTDEATTAYLDCFSGISGDMLLGALIGCGLAPQLLQQHLAQLDLEPYDLEIIPKKVQAIAATSVRVVSRSGQRFRNLADINALLAQSSLPPEIIERSRQIFQRLAEAEAKVHARPVEAIHFHEVGALDTIIDVVGAVLGFYLLGVRQIHCSPLPLGRGFVRCAHGNLPLPAPAVCELVQGLPVYGIDTDQELVTPTGAALAASLADHFGGIPPLTVSATGYGAGELPGAEDRPNLLRLIIGRSHLVEEAQVVEVIETHLDDWSPEGYPFLCDRLFSARALDVSLYPIQMKKGRPGFCLKVICRPHDSMAIKELILTETTAIGLRFRREQRLTLPRRQIEVETPWGKVSAKMAQKPDGPVIYPEYEACRQLAEKHGLSLERVYRSIIAGGADHS